MLPENQRRYHSGRECPTRDELDEFVAEPFAISDDRAARLDVHFERCPYCSHQVDIAARRMDREMMEELLDPPSPRPDDSEGRGSGEHGQQRDVDVAPVDPPVQPTDGGDKGKKHGKYKRTVMTIAVSILLVLSVPIARAGLSFVFPRPLTMFFYRMDDSEVTVVKGTPAVIRGAYGNEAEENLVELKFNERADIPRVFAAHRRRVGAIERNEYLSKYDGEAAELAVLAYSRTVSETPVSSALASEVWSEHVAGRSMFEKNLIVIGGPSAVRFHGEDSSRPYDWWTDLDVPFSFEPGEVVFRGGGREIRIPAADLRIGDARYEVGLIVKKPHPQSTAACYWLVLAGYSGAASESLGHAINDESVVKELNRRDLTEGVLVLCPTDELGGVTKPRGFIVGTAGEIQAILQQGTAGDAA